MLKKIAIVGVLTVSIGVAPIRADDDALLSLLVRKHLITEQDAAEVRAEIQKKEVKQAPTASAKPVSETKLKLSSSVSELELYGDARLRYEVRNGQTAAPDPINRPGDTFQRDRARYRLRLGLRGTLVDDWF